jgi:short-subunit dehydrogenase
MVMRRELTGLRVLVTGASQGIGRAIAYHGSMRVMRVMAAARNWDLLVQLKEEVRANGQTLDIVQADVASPEGRAAMVQAVRNTFGGVDVLINNAGIGASGHFAESSPEVLRSIMEVNFFGTVETTRAMLPMLIEGKTPAVVNVSSILGRRAIPGRSLYSASKFAVEGWTQAIRAEFARWNIDVITINPGLTQTNFSQNMLERNAKQSLDHMRGMTPDQVAKATLDALAAGKRAINLTVQGKALLFANRFLPGLVDRITKKKVRQLFADEIAARPPAGEAAS